MNKYRKVLGIFAVVVLVLIVGVTAVAMAQDDEPLPLPEPEISAPELFADDDPALLSERGTRGQQFGNQRRDRLFDKEEMDAALAAELGISIDELTTAREAARASLLQQAVDEGRLTQEQADQMLSGEFRPRDFMRSLREAYFPEGTVRAITAETLGMTVAELEAARADGKRLSEIAEEQGVELTAVSEAVKAAFAEAVAQAVSDGMITQAQADQILSHEGRFRGGDGFRGGGPRGGGPRG